MSTTTATALDALARDLLAVPENAALFTEPGVLIVQMAARITELRRRLDGVTDDCRVAEKWVGILRGQVRNLRADRDRAQDAAVDFAVQLGLMDAPLTTEYVQA